MNYSEQSIVFNLNLSHSSLIECQKRVDDLEQHINELHDVIDYCSDTGRINEQNLVALDRASQKLDHDKKVLESARELYQIWQNRLCLFRQFQKAYVDAGKKRAGGSL